MNMTILKREIAKKLFEEQGKDIIIPEIYTSIGAYAFQSLQITSIQIPIGIKTIGDSAFRFNQLTSVVIPKGVETIGWGAFMNNNLSNVVIPKGVKTIDKYAFNNNDLRAVFLPSSIDEYGSYAFQRNPLKYATVAEGAAIDKTFFPEYTIIDYNESPNDIELSLYEFDENIPKYSVVATLNTVDQNSGDMHTYSFGSGDGGESNDNGNFLIDGNEIRIVDSPDFEEKSVYSIRLKTTDSGGLVFEKEFKLDVNDINEKPNDLQLSKLTLDENISHETFVATLSTTDPDSNESHVYSFVSGEEGEDDDNGNFLIDGNKIRIIDSPDFEEKSVYSIRLKTTDSGGLNFEKEFKLDVNDINEKPNDLQLSKLTLDENISHETFVATLSTTDPDSNESHVYSFVSGEEGEDDDNGNFLIDGNKIRIIDSPDFEEKSVYSIRLKTTDSGGLNFEKEFKLDVNDINEKPNDLQLSKLTLDENISHETFVATLSTTDPDSNESHIYSFESGEGGEDNDKFMIKGNQLLTSPNFEKKESYSIRLNTSDAEGLDFVKEFRLMGNYGNQFNIIKSTFGKGKLRGTKSADQLHLTNLNHSLVKPQTKLSGLPLPRVTPLGYLQRHSLRYLELMHSVSHQQAQREN